MSDLKAPTTASFEPARWREIAQWLANTDIDCAEVTGPGWQVRMLRETGYHAVEVTGAHTAAATAPVAGVFLDRHPLRSSPLVCRGQSVRQGDIVALLQIGQVLAPVASPVNGVVASTLVSPGTLVGYGAALVAIDTGELPWKSI
jgi:acetyl-CoA carboxylase biotin carboxyl carrier protein